MSWFWIVGIVAGVMLIIILSQWLFIVWFKRMHRSTLSQLRTLEAELRNLKQIVGMADDKQVQDLLRHRASLLSRLMIGEIAGDGRENDSVMEEIEKLVAGRDEFMYQNRLLYERWQPKMILHLREAGLDDREVEICCLYALGLNGKTIQQYTRDGRHYQNVGLIRRKLGLNEHDKNIDGYIKSLIR